MKQDRSYSDGPASGHNAANKLRGNLQTAIRELRDRESGSLVNTIVRDVANLVSTYGEQHLRDQYDGILSLAQDGPEYASPPLSLTHADDYINDVHHINEANRDILDKMSEMRCAVHVIEDRRKDEVRALVSEIDKYKRLLAETEKKLMKERSESRRLRDKLDRLKYACKYTAHESSWRSHSSCSSVSDGGDDSSRFGFGALTVRSCQSRNGSSTPMSQTARPISAKSRKHGRDRT